MELIKARVSALTTTRLKEMAQMLINDQRDGADMVLSAVLDAMMARMPEADFVAFCEGL